VSSSGDPESTARETDEERRNRERREQIMRRLLERTGSTRVSTLNSFRDAAADVEARVAGKVKVGAYDDVKLARKQVDLEDRKAILGMKKVLARGAFIGVGLQVLIADVAFFIYAILNGWELPSEVMVGWLSATVVQTVGIVYVIARHLFPSRDPR
jgi:hypothetical protein